MESWLLGGQQSYESSTVERTDERGLSGELLSLDGSLIAKLGQISSAEKTTSTKKAAHSAAQYTLSSAIELR